MNDQIRAAAKRYKRHLDAIDGEQTTDEFRKSPYYVFCGGCGWRWDEDGLRFDQAILAAVYVNELYRCSAAMMGVTSTER